MREILNCPNCGAPIDFRHPYHCDYCGSSLNPEKEYELNRELEGLKNEFYQKMVQINNVAQAQYLLSSMNSFSLMASANCCPVTIRQLHDIQAFNNFGLWKG